MTCAHITVGGRVQGVGFRWFVKDAAERLGLTGTVRNLLDGDVEVIAHGRRGKIEKLVNILKRGNGYSRVDWCEIDWEYEPCRFDSFRIIL